MPLARRTTLITVLLFLAGLHLTGCDQSQPVSNQPRSIGIEKRENGVRGGNLTCRLTSPPKSFNYVMAADESTIVAALYMLTSRLIEFDHRTQKYVPGLAESWTMAADGRTSEVKLREGLKFSDGDGLTTDDVSFSLSAIYDERTGSPVFRDAMLIGGKSIETKKINDREIQLIFPQPVASAEPYLVNLGIMPSHVLGADLKAGKFAEAWKINSPPSQIVSSGPFVVESATPGEKIVYARNSNYWRKDEAGTQLPYIDKFTVEVIPDANNTFVRLSQSTLDIADRIRPTDFNELSKQAGLTRAFDAGPGLGIDHLWFNLNVSDSNGSPLANQAKRSWFANKQFRTAVASAIDRESISKITLQGMASPLHGFVSPANKIWLNPNLEKIEYSLAKAEALLKEAGFKKSGTAEVPVLLDRENRPIEFSLIVPAENEPRKLMAAVIQQDLAKLGIKMDIAPIEFAGVTERWTKTFDYDAILLGLSQTDIEPSSYASFLLSTAASHQWQPKQKTPANAWEARVDEMFTALTIELNQEKRKQLFVEIQNIMREEMPAIPIVARHVISASSSKIANYSPSSVFPYSLWNIDELFIKP